MTTRSPGPLLTERAVTDRLRNGLDHRKVDMAWSCSGWLSRRRPASFFGHPQDIEWCLADDDFQIVRSRPIITRAPAPP